MQRIREILEPTPIPKVVRITQTFSAPRLDDLVGGLRRAIAACPASDRIKPGMSIAITVGSRGIAMLVELVRALVEEVKNRGALPFIVPAMGSHGGATAEGQKELIAGLGVTEESAGCPIRSSMDIVETGRLDNGMPVSLDRNASEADGIIVFNRIKPHNSFRHTVESGLCKMLAIGLGKRQGAHHCHSLGMMEIGGIIEQMAEVQLRNERIFMGVGTVGNAYDRIAEVVAWPAGEIIAREKEAQVRAKANMPRLLLNPLDVLVVDQSGKEYSGGGIDANITGVCGAGIVLSDARITRIAILDLSEKSHGNAHGMGLAHVTTRRLADRIDYAATYANALTSRVMASGRTPIVMESDRLAIQAAIYSCNCPDESRVSLMRIPNTLHLREAYISEALMSEAARTPGVDILGEPKAMRFDDSGWLAEGWGFSKSSDSPATS